MIRRIFLLRKIRLFSVSVSILVVTVVGIIIRIRNILVKTIVRIERINWIPQQITYISVIAIFCTHICIHTCAHTYAHTCTPLMLPITYVLASAIKRPHVLIAHVFNQVYHMLQSFLLVLCHERGYA